MDSRSQAMLELADGAHQTLRDDGEFALYRARYRSSTNGTLQPAMGRSMVLRWLNLPADNPIAAAMTGRLERALGLVAKRLGAVPYFAGNEFTAADIISVFSLTTMRFFMPVDLAPYANILRYLQRIGARPAYQRAMKKGDPEMTPMLT